METLTPQCLTQSYALVLVCNRKGSNNRSRPDHETKANQITSSAHCQRWLYGTTAHMVCGNATLVPWGFFRDFNPFPPPHPSQHLPLSLVGKLFIDQKDLQQSRAIDSFQNAAVSPIITVLSSPLLIQVIQSAFLTANPVLHTTGISVGYVTAMLIFLNSSKPPVP